MCMCSLSAISWPRRAEGAAGSIRYGAWAINSRQLRSRRLPPTDGNKAFVLTRLRFASLRRRLLAAFIGVLFLSLALTAAIFWLQIRVYDVQQVQSDLG